MKIILRGPQRRQRKKEVPYDQSIYDFVVYRVFVATASFIIGDEATRIIPDGILPNHVMVSVIIAPEKSHHLWLGPIGGFWGITWFSERTEAGISNRQQSIKGEL